MPVSPEVTQQANREIQNKYAGQLPGYLEAVEKRREAYNNLQKPPSWKVWERPGYKIERDMQETLLGRVADDVDALATSIEGASLLDTIDYQEFSSGRRKKKFFTRIEGQIPVQKDGKLSHCPFYVTVEHTESAKESLRFAGGKVNDRGISPDDSERSRQALYFAEVMLPLLYERDEKVASIERERQEQELRRQRQLEHDVFYGRRTRR